MKIRCKHCEEENKSKDWNIATIQEYGFHTKYGVEIGSVIELGKDGWEDARFVCPNCGRETMGSKILLGIIEELKECD